MRVSIDFTNADYSKQILRKDGSMLTITIPKGTKVKRTPILGNSLNVYYVQDFSLIVDKEARKAAAHLGVIVPDEFVGEQEEGS